MAELCSATIFYTLRFLTPLFATIVPDKVLLLCYMQNVVFEPHPGPQTEALQRSEKEILYGGARGGGKSTAMTAWMVEPNYIENPLYRGLVIRRNYTDL